MLFEKFIEKKIKLLFFYYQFELALALYLILTSLTSNLLMPFRLSEKKI